MTHLEAERRYQFATQKLINLKWQLREWEFQAPANSLIRGDIHIQAGVLQKAIDNLLSADDFVYDVTAIDTAIPRPSVAGVHSPSVADESDRTRPIQESGPAMGDERFTRVVE